MSILEPFIIAIDGTSGSGKGTLSVGLAKHFGFEFLDTGKIYRIVASEVISARRLTDDIESIINLIPRINFSSHEYHSLHTPEISECASKIAVHTEVRARLNQMQRDFPNGHKGAVIDGRDIGTVIFPNAHLKFFVTASQEVCAERRFKQLQNERKLVSYADVLRDLKERDARDSERNASPTQAALDAVVVDTTNLDSTSVLELVVALSARHVAAYFS